MDIDVNTLYIIGAIAFGATSEVIGLLKIESNSVVQLLLKIARIVFKK